MIRAGGYQGPASVHTRGMRALADILPLEFLENVTQDGSKATSLLERTEAGALDLCYFASSYLAERVPALLALDLPFAFESRPAAYEAVDGQLGALLAASVAERTGFAVLAFWDNGFRHLSNRLRPLARPEDCQGLSIRTLDNRLHQDVFRSFGFDPVMIDVRDLPAAVAEHRVDAQENPLTNTVNFGLHRTHRFHSLTGHVFGVALLLANRAWLEPPPARGPLRPVRSGRRRYRLPARATPPRRTRVAWPSWPRTGPRSSAPSSWTSQPSARAAAPARDAAMAGLAPDIRATLGAA